MDLNSSSHSDPFPRLSGPEVFDMSLLSEVWKVQWVPWITTSSIECIVGSATPPSLPFPMVPEHTVLGNGETGIYSLPVAVVAQDRQGTVTGARMLMQVLFLRLAL